MHIPFIDFNKTSFPIPTWYNAKISNDSFYTKKKTATKFDCLETYNFIDHSKAKRQHSFFKETIANWKKVRVFVAFIKNMRE